MSSAWRRSALLLAMTLVPACGEELTAPATGSIRVTTATTGDPLDPDGYAIGLDGGVSRSIGTNGTLTLADVLAGDHELTLAGLASNCALAGPNPRTVTVTGGATVASTFQVECGTPSGSIAVTTTTSGESPDPDGYALELDGGTGQPIGVNGTVTFTALIEGEHAIRLSGLSPNCAVEGLNPRTVVVEAAAVEVAFEVTCGPPVGAIVVSISTAGPRPDPDGYSVSVDGGPEQTLATNGSLTINGLPVGDHQLQLTGLADNCVLEGANPRTVSVTDGTTSPVTFQVSCHSIGQGTLLFSSDRTGTSHLYRIREDGSNLVDLTPSMDGFDGDWSPDRSRIVFTTTRNEQFEIAVMNADGSNPVALGVSGGGPRWSPDGRKILFFSGGTFVSDGTIRVMNADGSDVVELTTGRNADWSPDGNRIAFERVGQCIVDICGADVYVMAADGTQVSKLTSNQSPFDFSGRPAWSPEGTSIAYAQASLFGSNGLFVMNPDGTDKRAITGTRPQGRPVWSPDGSAIAFAAFNKTGSTTELTVIPSSGGPGVVLASSAGSEYPTSWK